MQQILATYGVFPEIRRKSANLHCSQLTKVIDFWCFKIMDHKELALGIINRFKSAKGPHDGQRCFSSVFSTACTYQSFFVDHPKCPLQMSPVVPLVLMVAAGIHENADRANLEQRPVLMGGTINGKAPGATHTGVDEKGKTYATAIDKQKNCWLYHPSDPLNSPKKGFQIKFDNQVQATESTGRYSYPQGPDVPVNPGVVAAFVFLPLEKEKKFPSGQFERVMKGMIAAKKNLIKSDSDANRFDLCEISFKPDEDEELPSLETPGKKSVGMRLKPELVREAAIDLSQRVLQTSDELETFTATIEDQTSDDGNTTDKIASLQSTVNRLKSMIKGQMEGIEENACKLAQHAKMEGASSCQSLLLYNAFHEMKDNIEGATINRYLNLAIRNTHLPALTKTRAYLTQAELKLIIENFGGDFDSGMFTRATQKNLLTDNDLETSSAYVQFKEEIDGQAIMARDSMSTVTDDIEVNSIYQTQKVWKERNWVSNIDHLGSDDNKLEKITMIIWMTTDLYTILCSVINGTGGEDDSSSNDDDSE